VGTAGLEKEEEPKMAVTAAAGGGSFTVAAAVFEPIGPLPELDLLPANLNGVLMTSAPDTGFTVLSELNENLGPRVSPPFNKDDCAGNEADADDATGESRTPKIVSAVLLAGPCDSLVRSVDWVDPSHGNFDWVVEKRSEGSCVSGGGAWERTNDAVTVEGLGSWGWWRRAICWLSFLAVGGLIVMPDFRSWRREVVVGVDFDGAGESIAGL
jgi:hypothetical protein